MACLDETQDGHTISPIIVAREGQHVKYVGDDERRDRAQHDEAGNHEDLAAPAPARQPQRCAIAWHLRLDRESRRVRDCEHTE